MILPGISGSTLLLAFGLYIPIMTEIRQLLSFDFSVFSMLVVFGFGVLAGIFCSFRGIHYLLRRHRGATVAVILGLMVGSLVAVLRGPTTLAEPLSPLNFSNVNIGMFLMGILVVVGFAVVKIIVGKRRVHHD